MPPNRYPPQDAFDTDMLDPQVPEALLNSILADKELAHVFSVSAEEQEIIEHPSSCYVIGGSGTGKTMAMLFKILGIQRTWQRCPDMRPKPRQVFVAQSRVLATKVEERFAELMSSLEAAAHSPEEPRVNGEDTQKKFEFVDLGDSDQRRSDLPERFSDLLDEHFPLFITYDQLCTMLENDIRQGNHNDGSRLRAGSGSTSSSEYMSRRNFVSYDEFLKSYWDRLPRTSTRTLYPALVFEEFAGVIEGSEDTVGTEHRCLDRKSYKLLGVRRQGAFSHKRDEIYDLFLAYTKLKQQRHDYDAADRTHYILEGLREVGLAGQKVDFLYVDEVQDNLLIDTLALRTICANPHGLFWAGDTREKISIGSSLRFADLKAYQYRIEEQLSNESGLTHVKPRTFELALNYRSHSGIVNCARSVIELIIRYWPYSIDALRPVRAIIDGVRPTFFAGQENADLENSFFRNGQGKPIEFGADQCILVRNGAARERLQQRLARGSIIMTLHESKGLEFNDVLLYNFFEDSTATLNQWRLVLNGVSNVDNLSDVPTFDETRHASICVELKFLYVAITRARNRLWIMDSSKSAEPMKVYWGSNNQIEIWSPTAKVPRLAGTALNSEEWSKTGRTMFLNKRYAQASVAFQRAGRDREAKICDAYLFRDKAQSISTTSSTARTQAFITAAKAFIACAQNSPSKQVNERLAYYGTAGECYSEARDLKRAGDNYRMAERYTAAALAYREEGCFDEMVEVITQHGNTLESGLLERLTRVAQMHYFKRLNVKAGLDLFPSKEDALQFLEDYDLDEARVKLLEELGSILEAARIHAKNGDLFRAAEILTTSAHSVDHARPAIKYLLTGLWRNSTIGVLPTSDPISLKLLRLGDRLDKSAMTKQEVDELVMFKAIQCADHASLRTLAKTFIGTRNDPAALLCLDHGFSPPPKLLNLSFVEIQASLSLYLDYVRLLSKLRRDESLAEGSNRQRLFGFQVLGEDRYLAPRHTILHEKLAGRFGSGGESMGGYTCGPDELRRGIIQLILSRTSDHAVDQDGTCRDIHGFSPCLRLLIEKRCDSPNGQGSCTFQHVQPEQLTIDWYHSRLHLILLQFQILNSARYDELDVKNYWLGILYSALHPPLRGLGSSANLDIARIPEGTDGFRIAREWARDVCCDLGYNLPEPEGRFRQWFTVACTLALDLDRENARDFVLRTPMYRQMLWPHLSHTRDVNSTTQDFVGFVTAEAYNLLTFGSSYLREVLRGQLHVDLIVLCDLTERLSGLFIMANGVNSREGVLHNITLPRSWFINLILPDMDLGKDTSAFLMFVETTIELMQRIDAQGWPGKQFIADGSRITNFTGPLYTARICLCLCLMGYNTNDGSVKKKILTGIQSLRKGDGKFIPWIYRRYANAKGWDDLIHAFAGPLKHSSLDEMILLLHTTIPSPREQQSEYIRPVSYDTLDEIPRLLLSMAPSTVRTSAARKIQAVYRRHWKRSEGIDAIQAHYWHLLRKRSTEMEWSEDLRYYLLFRVPLGYILVCLDVIKTFVESEKKEAKKRVMTEDDEHLEELMEALDRYSKLLKKMIALQKKLSPFSKFHDGQSVTGLQHAVLEVKAIVESLDTIAGSIGTKNQIKKRWDRGWKWIFEK